MKRGLLCLSILSVLAGCSPPSLEGDAPSRGSRRTAEEEEESEEEETSSPSTAEQPVTIAEPPTLALSGSYTAKPKKDAAGAWTLTWEVPNVTTSPLIAVGKGPDLEKATNATIRGLPSSCKLTSNTFSLGGGAGHYLLGTLFAKSGSGCDAWFEALREIELEAKDAPYESGKKATVTIAILQK